MPAVRKARSRPKPPADLHRETSIRLDGLAPVEAGQEVSIRGERGRFRFIEHVSNRGNGAEWVTVYGPVSGDGQRAIVRSFTPDRVRTVHRLSKARPR